MTALIAYIRGQLARLRRPRARRLQISDAAGQSAFVEAGDPPLDIRRIREAVDRLPLEEREPLLLYWSGGLDHGQIAAQLSLSVRCIRARIARARMELRAIIEQSDRERARTARGGAARMPGHR